MGLQYVTVGHNLKKEGAILAALELLAQHNVLPRHTILLDADSVIAAARRGESTEAALAGAVAYMKTRGLAGMALRMQPSLERSGGWLQNVQYAEYVSGWCWNLLTARYYRLWVINGPGCIFRSEELLGILRGMEPDFESGDLLITVEMLKAGHRVGYYDALELTTSVPDSILNRPEFPGGTNS